MNLKAVARYCYANIPGAAAMRFAAKDLAAPYFIKPEFLGAREFAIGSGLIVDVGANRGQSTAAFRKVAPNCRIAAFEPEPHSASRVAFRYRRDATVTVHECALGSRFGVMTLFLPKYGRWDCDGMAATDLGQATEWLKNPGRMYRFDHTKLTIREHQVSCRTLDSYSLAPVLIKVHAQGAELDILMGSQETLKQQRPALMCAFPSPAVTEFVADFGYRPYVYNHGFQPGIAPRHVTFTWYLTDVHRMEGTRARQAEGSRVP